MRLCLYQLLQQTMGFLESNMYRLENLLSLQSHAKIRIRHLKVLEWIYTDEEGIIASSFGISGLDYAVLDGVVQTENRVHYGQGFPPVIKRLVFRLNYLTP